MKSLAEFLGVDDPKHPEVPVAPPPSRNLTAKQFCLEILSSPEYRASILHRVYLGELPPAVECLLYHYAHGKPVERVEVKDTTDPLDDFNAEQLENRALRLLEIARQLRTNDEVHEPSSDEDEGVEPSIVH